MKLEIKHHRKNALMKRDEVVVSIEHGGKATPNRRHILDETAKLLKAKPDCIIIDRILTEGGKAFSEARVLVYLKKDDVPAWRLKKMEQRLAKVKKAEEKPAEAAHEAPAEETPEAKTEEKEAAVPKEKPDESPAEEAVSEEPGEAATEENTEGNKEPDKAE